MCAVSADNVKAPLVEYAQDLRQFMAPFENLTRSIDDGIRPLPSREVRAFFNDIAWRFR